MSVMFFWHRFGAALKNLHTCGILRPLTVSKHVNSEPPYKSRNKKAKSRL